ncbi:Pimeloyl-ACP methyl ester carboxylesterase [Streptoalloteichus tenebrarius]|uniref:Pimeloyl-ACP methyl ester carboxylesterase n=1 Tax=Streptoalloteichus tenebrarius (strain ATCC 17920 / DSM 40477 / JCM 4838 / CBS 697.72 / NBRC 16177 / NCIMB 11028 / NRRL B-12390 / A12253. 1 / ISP 5477) TaxID=1933 RepID=A0ABT1HUF4_STRSD|nr:alpha/beta hydrolase [Streptoalloteichus tenebrarius]MCP2259158.1 Pimeloyl-ACP methyl ester carboxylesterase [Streptoalloteichus tenebrarius]BFF04365.1 alpha/beta fold hydrolase [Streptoalloteichus tenebrarius]
MTTQVAGAVLELAYERRGRGEPLVLLHGLGHHWQAWEPVLDRLAAHRDVVAVDLPGFGQSPPFPPHIPVTLDSLVDILASFFTRLGIDRPHVAGNSLGGFTALVLAQRGLACSATALAPAGFWTPAERSYALALLAALRFGATRVPEGVIRRLAGTRLGRALMAGVAYARPDVRTAQMVVAEVAALRSATAFEAVAAAARHTLFSGQPPEVPVTIAWGTRDRLLLPAQARRAVRAIPGARLVPLPGCGHVPMGDDPELVARVVLMGSRRR